MTTPPQTTRAKVRGDFIRFARAKNRSYTVDWTYLKLNGYWEETILCMDPFSSSNRRVEELKGDRKSTRLNSSHLVISYDVFCLKKQLLSHPRSRLRVRPAVSRTVAKP